VGVADDCRKAVGVVAAADGADKKLPATKGGEQHWTRLRTTQAAAGVDASTVWCSTSCSQQQCSRVVAGRLYTGRVGWHSTWQPPLYLAHGHVGALWARIANSSGVACLTFL
jgi:hypothetical protein